MGKRPGIRQADIYDLAKEARGLPIFDGIGENELKAMLHCLQAIERTYKKNEFILLEGENVAYIGVILSGQINMLKEDFGGQQSVLAVMGDKELFGETFVCGSRQDTTVSFQAAVPTRALLLPFHRVLNVCSNNCAFHHQVITNLVRMIADKNMLLMQKVEISSKKTLREKILTYLYFLKGQQNSNYIACPLDRQEMASFLNANRSSLSRELSLMQEEGILEYDRNMFHLLRTQ